MIGPLNSITDAPEVFVRRLLIALVFFFGATAHSQQKQTQASGHYLFAWTGDDAKKGNDFLAIIDADPDSASYGRLMTTLVTD
jgi:hypothetical protein